MSERNVEIARASVAAFNRGDFEPALATMHPDVEWHVFLSVEGEVVHGPDAVRQMWIRTHEMFQGFTVDVDEFVDAGDVVLAVGRFQGVAPGGVQISDTITQIYWIEDELLRKVKAFRTVEEARTAVERGD